MTTGAGVPCPNCGGERLVASVEVESSETYPNRGIPVVVLSCEECSETLMSKDADAIEPGSTVAHALREWMILHWLRSLTPERRLEMLNVGPT